LLLIQEQAGAIGMVLQLVRAYLLSQEKVRSSFRKLLNFGAGAGRELNRCILIGQLIKLSNAIF
jgi:hypothetical protein